ncbi:MAG: beta-glucosidase BglX [Bacteroidales bacterium]|nr:beta-glucosidase BglX [Bacteroidales bacterium]
MNKKGFISLLAFSMLFSCQRTVLMDTFIDDLMSEMTLEEKLGQLNLSGGVGALGDEIVGVNAHDYIRLGLIGSAAGREEQRIAVEESRLGIPLITGRDVIHGYTTTFPIPLAMSCSWDMEMIEDHARVAAVEATTDGVCWTWSPMVDISRDPRWGRVAEGGGEDPYLGSQIGRAYVRGYQGDDLSAPNTMLACVKHFALYGAPEGGRDYNTVDMSRIVMFQDFFPPYKAAFDAGAATAMTSFNVIDAVPATGNKWLMTDLLRDQWGFDGFVVTDYTAINEMIDHGLGDLKEVSAQAIQAGVDMDMMGQGYIGTLKESLHEGRVSQADIDRSCRRVLEAKYKLGLFEDPYRYFKPELAKEVILSAEHLTKAKDAAARSIVLLKNEEQLLPLKKDAKIAVVGPFANSRFDVLGTWAATSDVSKVVSIYEGLKQAATNPDNVSYAQGSYAIMDTFLLNRDNGSSERITVSEEKSEQWLREARIVAGKAQIIVAVLGESRDWSGEAASRSDISIPACQHRLLEEMLATGKPVVLVLSNGRPLTLQWEQDNVPAIVEAWHGGTKAGTGLAEVLFGDYNPSAKLTMSFPVNVGQIPIYYNHKKTGRPYVEGYKFNTKYLDIPNAPLYPFGYVLSYTSFAYGDIVLDKTILTGEDVLNVSVTVSNTGAYDGEEIVQLYLNDPVATVSRAVKELKGFKKVFIKKGESKDLVFQLFPEDLKYYKSDLSFDWDSGKFNIYVGSSSDKVKMVKVIWNKGN